MPNILSALRLALVPFIGWCILTGRFTAAGLLFAVAAVSDGLDGHLARRLGAESAFGAILDPIADKLLIGVVTLACAGIGLLPLWLAVLVVVRDILIVGGAMAIRLRRPGAATPPLPLGKASTAAQMLLLAAVLLPLQSGLVASAVPALITATAALTIISATAYGVFLKRSLSQAIETHSLSHSDTPSTLVTGPTIGEAEAGR